MENYEKKAKDFLKETKTRLSFELLGEINGFPHDLSGGDKLFRYSYKVTLKNQKGSYSFKYYDSHHNWKKNIQKLSAYDVLSTLTPNNHYPNVWEFARDYGYSINNEEQYREVSKVVKLINKQTKALNRLFTEKELEALQEII
jgi:hypothetical protein